MAYEYFSVFLFFRKAMFPEVDSHQEDAGYETDEHLLFNVFLSAQDGSTSKTIHEVAEMVAAMSSEKAPPAPLIQVHLVAGNMSLIAYSQKSFRRVDRHLLAKKNTARGMLY